MDIHYIGDIDDLREKAGIIRRNCVDRMTRIELAIRDAVRAVENMGADVRLTEAVNLLHAAREKVADFVDGKNSS
jgi:hypothetical protein